LIVGCGNSRLSEPMFSDGYKDLWSIDFVETAIDIMKNRAKRSFKELEDRYLIMDARNMSFQDSTFDAVVDKGTLDAMMCGKNNLSNCSKLCTEVSRILKPGGIFILITYGKPDSRMDSLDHPQFNWTINYTTVQKNEDNIHHIYYMFKNKPVLSV